MDKAFLVELDDHGSYSRFALTEKDFKNEFPDTDIERVREGDTDTLKPLTHIWAAEVEIKSEEWNSFFTDMSYNLPDSDVENDNLASIDYDRCSPSLKEAVKETEIDTTRPERVQPQYPDDDVYSLKPTEYSSETNEDFKAVMYNDGSGHIEYKDKEVASIDLQTGEMKFDNGNFDYYDFTDGNSNATFGERVQNAMSFAEDYVERKEKSNREME